MSSTDVAMEKENSTKKLSFLTEAAVEVEKVAYNTSQKLSCVCTIKAPELPETEDTSKRSPVDLVAVIDKSGSMRGEKLNMVIKTLEFMITQLQDKDRLGVILFDSGVEELFPLSCMNGDNQEMYKKQIKNIKDGSATNLSGGLLRGIQQIREAKEKTADRNEIASVLLFTDGIANNGLTSTSQIVDAVNTGFSGLDVPATLFTFGFGSDHNASMLREIAEAGKGMYYFLENVDSIPKAFGDCLGGLLSVVGQTLRLVISSPDESKVALLEIATKQPVSSNVVMENGIGYKQMTLDLNDIYSEEERNIVVRVEIPKVAEVNTHLAPCINFTLTGYNVVDKAFFESFSVGFISRPEEVNKAENPFSPIVLQQNQRLALMEGMEEAKQMASRGRYAEASSRMRQAETDIQNIDACFTSAPLQRCAKYENNQEDFQGFTYQLQDQAKAIAVSSASSSAWSARGSKLVSQQANCHRRERGNHMDTTYTNKKKQNMQAKSRMK